MAETKLDGRTVTLSFATLHTLRNRLGVIIGFVDLMLDETPEADPHRRDLLEIKEAAAAAAALLEPGPAVLSNDIQD